MAANKNKVLSLVLQISRSVSHYSQSVIQKKTASTYSKCWSFAVSGKMLWLPSFSSMLFERSIADVVTLAFPFSKN